MVGRMDDWIIGLTVGFVVVGLVVMGGWMHGWMDGWMDGGDEEQHLRWNVRLVTDGYIIFIIITLCTMSQISTLCHRRVYYVSNEYVR